jgi:outer membrane lipoprotein SlyB|uniref:Lipoprotein, putative n=1 Tax=uncultured marine bacterium 580 TaxID=257400 RepID=Q6SFM2_9BACT|nr:lipoprotein, putative [uncultured marine bacterium 580]
MIKNKISLITLLICFFLIGCASQTKTGTAYTEGQARQAQTIKIGIVENVKEIQIQSDRTGVGAIAGGAVGGIAGSTVGDGKGSSIAAVLGAVAGGLIGDEIEKKVNTLNGQEITVSLNDGTKIVVAQEIDDKEGPFKIGDNVRVLTSPSGTTRITFD